MDMSADLSSLPCLPSALSPGVRQLLGRVGSVTVSDAECVKAGVLNFDYISRLLPPWLNDNTEYFCDATMCVAPIFLRCEEILQAMTKSEFSQRYTDLLQWTGNQQLFGECFEKIQTGDGCDSLLALLLITSTLERALGDVFLLRGKQCPSMLKDLLLTQELQDIFGGTVIQLLRVVIGPPISLNIRNIAWHGFPSPGEIPNRFPWFLLLLVASLGRCLQLQGVHNEEIHHRSPVTFHHTHLLNEVLPGLEEDDFLPVQELLHCTDFVQSQYLDVWGKALTLYKQKRYGVCLVLLLPQLEHSLRRVFAAVNGCPERVLTAEATTLYTTFDEMFDKYLPSLTENAMVKSVGENCMDLLFDLLVYPDGPRVRDRLSHGETTLDTLPQSLVSAVISLAVKLSSLFIRNNHSQLSQNHHLQRVIRRVSEYKSLFHPIAVAKRQVLDLSSLTNQMTTWIGHTPQLDPWTSEDGMEVFLRDNVRFVDVQTMIGQVVDGLAQSSLAVLINTSDLISCMKTPFHDTHTVIRDVLYHGQVSTLYRGQITSSQTLGSPSNTSQARGEVRESEIVGLVTRILTEEQEVMSQIKVAMATRQDQLKQKQLRSRQRDNLKRLIESLPVLHAMTTTLCLLTAGLLANIDHLTSLDQIHMKKLQKFLKSCLQYSENMRTFSGPDRNKWVECVHLTIKFLPRFVSVMDENLFLHVVTLLIHWARDIQTQSMNPRQWETVD